MAIFNSYVKLPEGISPLFSFQSSLVSKKDLFPLKWGILKIPSHWRGHAKKVPQNDGGGSLVGYLRDYSLVNFSLHHPHHVLWLFSATHPQWVSLKMINGEKLGRTHKMAIEELVKKQDNTNYGGMGRFYTQQLYPPITTISNNTYKYLN